jgi:hypothetical protein
MKIVYLAPQTSVFFPQRQPLLSFFCFQKFWLTSMPVSNIPVCYNSIVLIPDVPYIVINILLVLTYLILTVTSK